MPAEVRARVFEPFFTTKEIGKGSGLGLSQVLGFAKQSGGGVRIESAVGQGTSVSIYLPRAVAKPAASEAAPGQNVRPGASGGAKIVLVDDDAAVREVTGALLGELGHDVREAGSGKAALELLTRDPQVDLVLIDFAMPGMNGAELAREVHSIWPKLPILFVTGFADRAALAGVSEARIIGKPFVRDELGEKVRIALAEGASEKVVRLRR
jgi:CheY-like chemotaxis protein